MSNNITFDSNLNVFLFNYNKLNIIRNDKIINEIYNIIKIINKKIKKIFIKINKLLLIFNTNVTDEYIVNELNKIKEHIYFINNIVVPFKEKKSEIDFISELDNEKNVYNYKLASSYLDTYIISLIRTNIIIANKITYIDNFVNDYIF